LVNWSGAIHSGIVECGVECGVFNTTPQLTNSKSTQLFGREKKHDKKMNGAMK
jgi:hypothetical protein